jgi:muramoyltetrapeptide carboxypeptidase
VAVIAPSSGLIEPSRLERGIRVLERFDLDVSVGRAVRQIRGYLAGEDRSRVDDLLWALTDEWIDAIWSARGGFGALRTVAALDPTALDDLIDRPPKPFIGFSDITGSVGLGHPYRSWRSQRVIAAATKYAEDLA